MQLNFLKHDSCEFLKDNITKNFFAGNYFRSKAWLEDFFESDFKGYTDIEFEDLELIPSDNNMDELENCKRVYNAFKNITIQQATEPQIWIYLTHSVFWDYMNKRWPIGEDNSNDKQINRIKSRYFLHYESKDRRLVRNGISRLWWFAYTTYDENYDNKFYLTEKLFLHEKDFGESLLTRSFFRNRDIVKNIIKAVCKYEEKFRDNIMINRDIHRPLFVEINRIGAVKLLDALEYEDIEEIVFRFIDNFDSKNK